MILFKVRVPLGAFFVAQKQEIYLETFDFTEHVNILHFREIEIFSSI